MPAISRHYQSRDHAGRRTRVRKARKLKNSTVFPILPGSPAPVLLAIWNQGQAPEPSPQMNLAEEGVVQVFTRLIGSLGHLGVVGDLPASPA